MICEDNNAVIAMCKKGRPTTMRHLLRVHRVDLDTLWERLRTDPSISMRYVNTKQQLADILTKGSFTKATWNELRTLIQIGPGHKHSTNNKTVGMEMAGAVARKATIMEIAACKAKIANLKSFKIARLDGEPAVRAKDRAIIATPAQLCCTKSSETQSSNKIRLILMDLLLASMLLPC